jgi:Uma2 family endonuclease
MIAAGAFAPGERLELMDGEIFRMPPQGSAHYTAVQLAEEACRAAFAGRNFSVRVQGPLAPPPDSEPVPDVAVVSGCARDYSGAHPTSALLVVEIADSTLEYDRGRKAGVYARAGIQEYWIVNLIQRCLEVHRQPVGGIYGVIERLAPSDSLSPPAAPHAEISVADLLP